MSSLYVRARARKGVFGQGSARETRRGVGGGVLAYRIAA